MEIKSTEPGLRAGEDPGLKTTGELNLYLDLLAFSELSPDQRVADSANSKDAISNQILESAGEFPGFVEAADTLDTPLPPAEPADALLEYLPAVEQAETVEQPAEEPRRETTEVSEPVFEFLPAAEQAAEQSETVENTETVENAETVY